ncbi:MAG TPA: ion transporter [Sphingomonadaceae bacterium]
METHAQSAPADRLDRWRALARLEEWLHTPMLVLSIVWLAVVVIQLLSSTDNVLLGVLATGIYGIFIIEFVVRFVLAPDKRTFLKHNWLTLIALVVPAFRMFRVIGALRIAGGLRGVRLIQVIYTANRSMTTLKTTLARRKFGYVVGLTLLVMFLGAAGMFYFEPAAQVRGGFTSYWDAVWWTGMLLTTIGSQFWPVTPEGRVLAFMLSLYGVAVLGYLAATLASFFIGRDAQEPAAPLAGADDLNELRKEIAALREALEAHTDGLRQTTPPARVRRG